MAVGFRSGTPVMCMSMAPPEQRECVPTSSGANLSLAAPTRRVSALGTEMMFEALTERSPGAVGYFLTRVVTGRLCSRRWKKMLTPAQTGQAVRDSDMK